MSPKVLWTSLLATPAVLSAAILVSSSAIAAEAPAKTDADALGGNITAASTVAAPVAANPSAPATAAQAPLQVAQAAPSASSQAQAPMNNVASLDEIMQYSNEGQSQAQVTSISQLSDVQPTDWAFQALQSLVERYGCIAGYPDGTYKGQRAMTRFEFAAGLNACLDRISELIASSTADLATKEDLATLQRLQEEFAAELATLRGRVDSLEARVGELEANQFSTTTKLKGETIFAAAANFSSDEDFVSDQPIAGYRVRLNFDTSFTGNDLLRARLQARDFNNFYSFGGSVGSTEWTFSGEAPGEGANNNVVLDKLYYTFPVGNNIQVNIGARGFSDSDFVTSTVSPFDDDAQGSVSNFGTPAQYNFIPGGTGAGAIIQLSDNFSFDFGYAADNGDAPDSTPGSGLFNGSYGAIAQITYLSDFVDAALTYANSYNTGGFFSNLGVDGGPEVANVYGGQVNFKFGQFEVGGGLAYIPIRAIGEGDYNVWSYQGTLALRDFGTQGSLLGILAGVAPYAAGVPAQIVSSSAGANQGTNQGNNVMVEGFYKFQLNDNISITPSLIWMSAPGNDNDNSDTFVGAIRTSFTF